MSTDLSVEIHKVIAELCDRLLLEQQLITTKGLIIKLNELYPQFSEDYSEDFITTAINAWRIANLKASIAKTGIDSHASELWLSRHINSDSNISNNNVSDRGMPSKDRSVGNDPRDDRRYKKKLLRATKEIQILKAKVQALQSFYDRQRKELVMRIEGMLYQK